MPYLRKPSYLPLAGPSHFRSGLVTSGRIPPLPAGDVSYWFSAPGRPVTFQPNWNCHITPPFQRSLSASFEPLENRSPARRIPLFRLPMLLTSFLVVSGVLVALDIVNGIPLAFSERI